MKMTIELPEHTMAATLSFVFQSEESGIFLGSYLIDSDDIKRGYRDYNPSKEDKNG